MTIAMTEQVLCTGKGSDTADSVAGVPVDQEFACLTTRALSIASRKIVLSAGDFKRHWLPLAVPDDLFIDLHCQPATLACRGRNSEVFVSSVTPDRLHPVWIGMV